MGTPYTQTVLRVWEAGDGRLRVMVELRRSDGTHKRPQLLQKPWEHVYTLSGDVTVESLFWRIKALLRDLDPWWAEPPAPPEGATGGQ